MTDPHWQSDPMLDEAVDQARQRNVTGSKYTTSQLRRMREQNNPHNKPTGPHTGRCQHCGSDNLWDDNLAYGCRGCGALLGTN